MTGAGRESSPGADAGTAGGATTARGWAHAARRVFRLERPIAALAVKGDHLPRTVRARLVAEILPVYALMRWRMARTDFRELVGLCRDHARTGPPVLAPLSADAHLAALRIGHAVARTLSVLPTDARCLVQSLVTLRLLSARGIPAQLVIGARSSPGFEAHAWIEHAGGTVLPTQGFDDARLLVL